MKFHRNILLSPLASAFVIPGLGQVLNGQPKKALLLMGAVFFEIMIFSFQFIGLIKSDKALMDSINSGTFEFFSFLKEKTQLALIFIVLLGTWVYGIIDSFCVAFRISKEDKV